MAARRGLVFEVRGDSVRLAVASSYGDESHLLRDLVGRSYHPLDFPAFWHDLRTELTVADAVRIVQEFFENGHIADQDELEDTLACLMVGLKRYAECREEWDLERTTVVVPAWFGDNLRSLVSSSCDRARFENSRLLNNASAALFANDVHKNYERTNKICRALLVDIRKTVVSAAIVEIEDEIFEVMGTSRATVGVSLDRVAQAVNEAFETTRIYGSDVNAVVIVGESDEIVYEEAIKFMDVLFPDARLYDAQPREEASVIGGMRILSYQLNSSSSSIECTMCFPMNTLSIGIEETSHGIFTPILLRNSFLPTRKTIYVRTFADRENESVSLRFYEGERPFVRDNRLTGELRVAGLRPGVNTISVCVDMDLNDNVTITARIVDGGEDHDENRLSFLRLGLSAGELYTLVSGLRGEDADEADEVRRQEIWSRGCSTSLVHLASQIIGKPTPAETYEPGEILVVRQRLSSILSETAHKRLSSDLKNIMDAIIWSDFDVSAVQSHVHDVFLERLKDDIMFDLARCSCCAMRT